MPVGPTNQSPLPDIDRATPSDPTGANRNTRTFAELVIDSEEDRTLRAVLVGILRHRPLRANSLPHFGQQFRVERLPHDARLCGPIPGLIL
jgi:hypothetical protein